MVSSGDTRPVVTMLRIIDDPGNKAVADRYVRMHEDAEKKAADVQQQHSGKRVSQRSQEVDKLIGYETDLVEQTKRLWQKEAEDEIAIAKNKTDSIAKIRYNSNVYAQELGTKMRADAEKYSAQDIRAEQQRTNQINQLRYNSNRYAQELGAKMRADAEKYSAEDEKSEQRLAAVKEHASRQIEAAQMRIHRSMHSVMHASTELTKSILYLGASGSSSMEGLLHSIVKIEGVMGIVSGAMNLEMGLHRLRNNRSALGRAQATFNAARNAGTYVPGSAAAMAGGEGAAGGFSAAGFLAGGAMVAGGVGLGLGAESLLSGNLRTDVGRLTGAIDDGASKVNAALVRFAEMIHQRETDFSRASERYGMEGRARTTAAGMQMDIAGLPDYSMSQFQKDARSRLKFAQSNQFSFGLDRALEGYSFSGRHESIEEQRKVDEAKAANMWSNYYAQTDDQDRSYRDRMGIARKYLAGFRSDRDKALANPATSINPTPSSDYSAWRADMQPRGIFDLAGGSPMADLKFGWWRLMNGRGYEGKPSEQDYKDYYDQSNAEDIKSGKKKPAMVGGSNTGSIEGTASAAGQDELSMLEKIKALEQERVHNIEARKQISMEIANVEIQSLEKQRDAYAQLAVQEQQRLYSAKESFAFADPAQKQRIMDSADRFKQGKLTGDSVSDLIELKQLHDLGVAGVDDKAYNAAIQKFNGTIPGAGGLFKDSETRVKEDTDKANKLNEQVQVAIENKLTMEINFGGFEQSAVSQLRDVMKDLMEATVREMRANNERAIREQNDHAVINGKTKDATGS